MRTPSSNLIVTVFILNVTEGGFTPAPTVRLQIKFPNTVKKTNFVQEKSICFGLPGDPGHPDGKRVFPGLDLS